MTDMIGNRDELEEILQWLDDFVPQMRADYNAKRAGGVTSWAELQQLLRIFVPVQRHLNALLRQVGGEKRFSDSPTRLGQHLLTLILEDGHMMGEKHRLWSMPVRGSFLSAVARDDVAGARWLKKTRCVNSSTLVLLTDELTGDTLGEIRTRFQAARVAAYRNQKLELEALLVKLRATLSPREFALLDDFLFF
jgi:hypothetical protein